MVGASLMKVVPFIGTVVGVAGTCVTIGAFTFATGKVFQEHFESEGDFLNFDAAAYKEHFKTLLKRGEKVAEEAKAEAEADAAEKAA